MTVKSETAARAQLALPEYLVFLILGHIKELRIVSPDHILVKAVADALNEQGVDIGEYEQLELLDVPAFLRRQAD